MAQERSMQATAIGVLAPGARPRLNLRQHIGHFCRRKPLGALGAVIAILLVLVAIFAPLIATDNPRETNSKMVFASPSAEAWLGGDQLAVTCSAAWFMGQGFPWR